MTTLSRDDRWEQNYKEIMMFMIKNRRRPSKHQLEDHRMLNWIKYNKKMMAAGLLSEERRIRFNALLSYASELRRLNQYVYGRPRSENPSLATELSLFSEQDED